MNKDTTLISVLCFNRLEITRRCIGALLRHTNNYHLRITDNGSTDGTAQYLATLVREHPSVVTVVTNAQNQGFIHPNNEAFKLARQCNYALFVALNNDTIPPPDWLTKLKEPLQLYPDGALSGASGTCHTIGKDFHGHPNGPLEYIEGSCLCVRVSAIAESSALFSDYLDFAYGEDTDLSLRMREAGYSIHEANFRIPHARGETSKQPGVLERCRQAQRHNHDALQRRWHHYMKARRFDYPIIIRRSGAMGDVLLTTPIIRAIKKSNPLSPILIETNCPEVFAGNPHAVARARGDAPIGSLIIDLELAYENRPQTHIVRAYENVAREAVRGMGSVELRTELFAGDSPPAGRRNLCVMHFEDGWPGKTWPAERASEIEQWLQVKGWEVIKAGRAITPVPQLCSLLRRARLFVGQDSFPLHAAQAAGCPVVALFGVTDSRYILTDGSKAIAVESDRSMPNSGLRHRIAGKTFLSEGRECMEAITTKEVIKAIEAITE